MLIVSHWLYILICVYMSIHYLVNNLEKEESKEILILNSLRWFMVWPAMILPKWDILLIPISTIVLSISVVGVFQ